MDPMSYSDGTYLHFESRETPLHIGNLMLLQKPKIEKVPFFKLITEMASMSSEAQSGLLFRRKLAPIPFNLFNPFWIQSDVDINQHLRHIYLPAPGSKKQLENCVAKLHSTLLDRNYPLWEIAVIEGLESGEIGVYTKIHHSLLDGAGAVNLREILLNTIPSSNALLPQPEHPNSLSLFLRALKQHDVAQIKLFLGLPKLFINFLSELRKTGVDSFAQFLPTFAPKTLFNKSITHERTVSFVSLPLDLVQFIANECNVNINEVLFTICSGALREFLSSIDNLPKETLIAGVPVSLRKSKKTTHYSNQIGTGYVSLATDIADPLIRLQVIHDAFRSLKKKVIKNKIQLNAVIDLPAFGVPWIFSGFSRIFEKTKLADYLPFVANVNMTYLPGPKEPINVAGYKILSSFPISAIYHGMGLNISMMSNYDSIDIGIIAAKNTISDASEIAERINDAFKELSKKLDKPSAPTKE